MHQLVAAFNVNDFEIASQKDLDNPQTACLPPSDKALTFTFHSVTAHSSAETPFVAKQTGKYKQDLALLHHCDTGFIVVPISSWGVKSQQTAALTKFFPPIDHQRGFLSTSRHLHCVPLTVVQLAPDLHRGRSLS